MKRISGFLFVLLLALVSTTYAQTTTHALSNTPTCTATAGTHPSLDIYYGTLAGNGTPALPGTSASCIQGDEIELNPTQATNGSFTYTVSAADGTVHLGGAIPVAIPISTGGSTNTQLILLYKYNAVASTPEWDLIPQATVPSTAPGTCVSGVQPVGSGCNVVTVTSAQIKAFDGTSGTSVELLAGAGANTFIQVKSVEWEYVFGTEPYGGSSSGPTTGNAWDLHYLGLDPNIPATDIWQQVNVGGDATAAGLAGVGASFLVPFTPHANKSSYGYLYAGATASNPDSPNYSPISQASNKAVMLNINPQDGVTYGNSGGIATASVTDGGLLYAMGDTGTVAVGFADATYTVTSVGAGGAVTGFTITPGTSYQTGAGQPTSVTTGSGDGNFTVDITAITLGDGTLKVFVWYDIDPL